MFISLKTQNIIYTTFATENKNVLQGIFQIFKVVYACFVTISGLTSKTKNQLNIKVKLHCSGFKEAFRV